MRGSLIKSFKHKAYTVQVRDWYSNKVSATLYLPGETLPVIGLFANGGESAVQAAKKWVDERDELAAARLIETEIAALLRSAGIATGSTLSMVRALIEREKALREEVQAVTADIEHHSRTETQYRAEIAELRATLNAYRDGAA